MTFSDECLLASEARHRVANDLGVAVGALRLASDGLLDAAMTASAVARMEAAAEINRALCFRPAGVVVPLAPALEPLRSPLARVAMAQGWRLRLSLAPIDVDDRDALRIAMIVHELVANALRHAAGSPTRTVDVVVDDDGRSTTLTVADGGRASRWARPDGQGGRIVDALAAELGGRVERGFSGGSGLVVVAMPSIAGGPAMRRTVPVTTANVGMTAPLGLVP